MSVPIEADKPQNSLIILLQLNGFDRLYIEMTDQGNMQLYFYFQKYNSIKVYLCCLQFSFKISTNTFKGNPNKFDHHI